MHSCICIVLENEKQEVASVPVKGQLDPPKCEGGIVGVPGGRTSRAAASPPSCAAAGWLLALPVPRGPYL